MVDSNHQLKMVLDSDLEMVKADMSNITKYDPIIVAFIMPDILSMFSEHCRQYLALTFTPTRPRLTKEM